MLFTRNILGVFFCKEEKLIERDVASWQLQGEPTVLVTIAHIFNYFAPLMVSMPLNTSCLLQWNYLVLLPYWLRQSTLCVCVYCSVKCTWSKTSWWASCWGFWREAALWMNIPWSSSCSSSFGCSWRWWVCVVSI